ncbi:MAG: CaiB/BaiF CoA-transferase family protein [Bacteroidota bacterium]|nr:CaiB/BaiF CoA-transferase family protein [Bacteroidota bacterium]
MKIKPLTGVKILDLTRLLPGPMCTLHLADMGADVLKIEELSIGDYARLMPPMQNKNSVFFHAVNRNKRSIAIDLTKEEGRLLFLKLSETADIIVESFRPGVVNKLGIDYETLKKNNPKLIYCSITGYGQTGPYRDKAGHDINYCAYTGVLDRKEEQPFIPNFQIADVVGGSLNAAMGILAALVQQKMTGEGQYIDVSIMDGILAHATTALAQVDHGEHGFLTGALPCYSIYETSDKKFMALGALEFKFWERFCKAIDRADLVIFHMVAEEQAQKVFAEVSAIFESNTQQFWIDKFKDIDCCVSPILTLKESLDNEQVKARNMIQIKNYPDEGEVLQFGLPLKFSSFQFEVEMPAPLLGEHTEQELLAIGYSKIEIEQLRKTKIIL